MTTPSAFIRLHARDDVLIACHQLVGGTSIENITVRGLIPGGHKVAIRDLKTGDPIRRYNQIIGFATKSIQAGEHVHVHNCSVGDDKGSFQRDYAFCTEIPIAPAKKQATFMGYRRSNGQVATRNYIGVLSSVNCSATVARGIADFFFAS
jgi:altronate hydrolase